MEEITFNSIQELYNRLLPALKSKKKMISSTGFTSIKEKDIWEYLYTNKWSNEHGIALCDMVTDILHTENELFIQYYERKYINNYNQEELGA